MLSIQTGRTGRTGRKQRTVKNAYVDIDCVNIEPGYKFFNWIPITKSKLKVCK